MDLKRMLSILLVLSMMLSSFSFAYAVEDQYEFGANLSKETYSPKESIEISGNVLKSGSGYSYTPVFIKVWNAENSDQPKLTGEVSTDSSGNYVWSKPLTGLDDGKYIVKLDSQIGLNKELEFYITSNKSSLELSKTIYRQGEEVKIDGTVYSNGEIQSYASVNIKVYLDGKEKFVDDLTADKDGEFSTAWALPLDQELGDYIVQVDISGKEILEEVFTVKEKMKESTLVLDKTAYKQGEEVRISGIAYSNGVVQPYASVNVKIYLEGIEKFVDDLTANKDGEFSTAWSLPLDQEVGNYIVVAEILDATLEEEFTVEEHPNKSILELDNSSYKQGEEVEISGIVFKNGEILPYASINIKVYLEGEEKFVKDLISDKDGKFGAVWSLSKDQEQGTYTVQADISGEETLEKDFIVEEKTNESTLQLDKESYYRGETVEISGKAMVNNEVQPNKEVNVKIVYDGEIKHQENITTNSLGNYNATYELGLEQELGSYIVVADILGKTLEKGFEVRTSGGGTSESILELDKSTYVQGEEVKISGIAYKDGETQPYVPVIIKVFLEGKEKFVRELTTDKDGEFSTVWNLSGEQEPGTYTVQVDIAGEETLEKELTVVETHTNESTLQLNKESYYRGETVEISGIAMVNNEAQSGEEVNIKIVYGGEVKHEEKATTDSLGNYNATYELALEQELGSYTVVAEILGKTLEKVFEVRTSGGGTNESILELDKSTYVPGEEVKISGIAYKDGEAQAYVPVIIKVFLEGKEKFVRELTTDKDGEFSTVWNLSGDQEPGTYTVQVDIAGEETLEKELTVVKTHTNESTLQLDKESYYRGETVEISGIAMVNNEVQPNKEVNVKIVYDGEIKHQENITTNSLGNYNATYELSLEQQLGDYTVVAEILGKTLEEGFVVKEKTNESTLQLDKESYYRGETVAISGKVMVNNEVQSGEEVNIKIVYGGEVKHKEKATTDSLGNYNATYQLRLEQELGNYTVVAETLGKTLEKGFEVKRSGGGTSESILELDKSTYVPGEEVKISGIAYKDGETVPYASVIVKVYLEGEGKFVKDLITDKDGEFSTVWTLSEDQELGTYIVQVDISGEETLEKELTVAETQTNESTLGLDKESYYKGETVAISGKAMANNEVQPNAQVNIKILYGGEVKYEENTTTDSLGNYKASYELSLEQELGNYTVVADILGKTLEEVFVVKEKTHESTLQLDKESYYRGETVAISGKAMVNNEVQPNAQVNIKILCGGEVKHEENTTTDSLGSYNATYVLSSEQALGSYTVVAEISGETIEKGFAVVADTNGSTLVVSKESYYRGEAVEISGKAILNNELQSGATVNVKVLYQDEVKFAKEFTTDSQGLYKTTYQLASNQILGNYKVKVEILGTIIEKSFEVKKQSTGGEPGGGTSGSSGGSVTDTEKETKKIKSSGGKVELLDGEVVLDIVEGTFDNEVNVSVSIVDEEDITLPKSTSTTKLMIAGKIYEFDSDGASFNKPVAITLEYDTDKVKNPEKLGVYFYNEETKEWEYIGGKVDVENGTITVELQHFSKYAVIEFDKTFDDINIPWAKKQIEVLASRHIVNGINENSYAPNANISRAAFAKLLVKALNLKASDNVVKFYDIEEDVWYTEPVEIAASLEIVKGYGDNFNPEGEITREAMAVIIVRALKQVDPDGDYITSDLGFGDTDSISDWAKSEVAIASSKGLVTGVSSTEFAPKENATRAQAAVIIYRLLELLDRL